MHNQIDQIKQMTVVKKTQTPTFKMAAAATYDGIGKRSPFKPVVHTFKRNTPAGPLEEFAISELKFIGTLQKNNQLFAVILTPDGRVYDVNVGEFMGRRAAKIVNISHESVVLQEIAPASSKNKKILLKLVSS